MSNQSQHDDRPLEVIRVAPKLSRMTFGELMQSLRKTNLDVLKEELRRAGRG